LHRQSDEALDMAGALELAGHRLSNPPEQNTPSSHGSHGAPDDALPLYPGRHTHWSMLTAPAGEVELAGQTATGTYDVLPEEFTDTGRIGE
jgi:hypothetical protein